MERSVFKVVGHDMLEALALLTRLPVRSTFTRGGAAAWAWPIAGMVVALFSAMAGIVALSLGAPAPIAAGLALTVQVMFTGALHEDGLADTTDGFWGAQNPERRLEIMKDSHIGAFGVMALLMTSLVRWGALTTILATASPLPALLSTAMLSRAAMAGVMAVLPNPRNSGLSSSVGAPSRREALYPALLASVIAVLLAGLNAAFVIAMVFLVSTVIAAIAKAKIGGQTGDVLGATQVVTEVAALCCFTVLLAH